MTLDISLPRYDISSKIIIRKMKKIVWDLEKINPTKMLIACYWYLTSLTSLEIFFRTRTRARARDYGGFS